MRRLTSSERAYLRVTNDAVADVLYRAAVEWIADNDEPGLSEPAEVERMISVALVADLFRKRPDDVAGDVLALR